MGRAVKIDPDLQRWLDNHGLGIDAALPVTGGCIAASYQLQINDGSCLFVKQMATPVEGMFAAEAAGLEALRQGRCLGVPEPLFQNENCLAMAFIHSARPVPHFDELLGRGLAEIHQQPQPSFGFERDTFCGSTRQPNNRNTNGFEFYSEQRFIYLGRCCLARKLLSNADMTVLEKLCLRLDSLIPEQPPSLLHGDLWRGNVHVDAQGDPVLIDPAVYCGWAEADIAMTRLFGGFSADFYHAYNEVNPLQPGWEQRLRLYNLWHLMNHLLLFGESYLYDVRQVLQEYG